MSKIDKNNSGAIDYTGLNICNALKFYLNVKKKKKKNGWWQPSIENNYSLSKDWILLLKCLIK